MKRKAGKNRKLPFPSRFLLMQIDGDFFTFVQTGHGLFMLIGCGDRDCSFIDPDLNRLDDMIYSIEEAHAKFKKHGGWICKDIHDMSKTILDVN